MLRVWALISGFAIAAIALTATTLADRPVYMPDVHIHWSVLAVAFAFCLATSIHFEVRRQAQGVQLSQLPLVLGLFFCSPVGLVAAAAVGTGLSQIKMRLPVVKAAFNIAMITCSTAVDVALFRWLVPEDGSVSPSVWPATFASSLADDLIAALAIALVIGIFDGQWSLARMVKVLQFAFLINVVTTSLALVAVTSLSREFDTAWMLLLIAALTTVAVHGHHRLNQRHQALRRLYDFASDLGPVAHEVDDLGGPLREVRELLHAEEIELCLFNGETGLTRVVVAEESVTTDVQLEDVTLDEQVAAVLLTGESHLTKRHRMNRFSRTMLAADGSPDEHTQTTKDMLIAPVGGADRRIGALIAHQRNSDLRQFDQEDLRLLETIADQLHTALEKGRLVENLRRAATRDSLTGLANLDAIRAHLTGLLAQRADTAQESGVVVVFVDLDRFQDVNDTLGHDAGDRLLVDVAQRLSAAAPHEAIAARVGADKFVLVLRGSASSEVARLAAIAI
jgi:GGDEF domain-containing protein